MSSANMGWLFYKDYFNSLDKSDYEYFSLNMEDKSKKETIENKIKQKVENIILQTPQIDSPNEDDILGNIHFQATTTYPGLLLGSGNTHELPSIQSQAILGFHFDYTSGLPLIQGSSIKGVLRSAFEHPEFVEEILKEKCQVESIDVSALKKEIFDNGDVFHDAVIIKADNFNKILGDDFLAPHGTDPLKNPIPLRFIKVLPLVTFRFDFDLSDGMITKEQKLTLFQNILSDLGLGAKTNVGYGKFVGFASYKTEKEKENDRFEEILQSENIQTIRNFIQANKTHPKLSLLEEKIVSLEQVALDNKFSKVNDEAKNAYENAIKDSKTKKKFLQSWIKKWENEDNNQNSSFILDLVAKAKQEL